MFVSRRSDWGFTGKVLTLALALALVGCGDDDDDDDDEDCTGGAGSPVALSGKVTYDFIPATYSTSTRTGTLGFAQAVERPVRSAVVQVRQGTNTLATGTTDEQGNYQLSYTPGACGALTLVALAKSTNPEIQVEDNTDGNAIWALGDTLTATAKTKNLHATHGWNGTAYTANARTAAPFAILDSMYTASKAFMAVRSVTFPALKVNWSPDNVPQNGNKANGEISTSHFSFTENEIYILGKAGVDTDEYDSHVIVHEWGHYFEANLSRADSPGGPHSTGDVLDPRLAFGEGYGNALAAMLLPESMYVDTLWTNTPSGPPLAFGFDAEAAPSPTDDPSPSVFSESSVMRALYDVYDSGANEAHDGVALGLGPIYDVLVGPQKSTDALTTLGSFIAGLKAQPGVNEAAVNTLMAHYGVGAVTSPFGDGDSKLRGMYTFVPSGAYPYSATATLHGKADPNKQQQNRYYVFTGTGRTMNISAANASEDVGIEIYKRGELVGSADEAYQGTESVSIPSTSGAQYVLVVTGFSARDQDYPASVSITSP